MEEQLKLDNQLCFPLYSCARKIVASYTPHLKPYGITYTQYIVFLVLWEHGDSNVSFLSEKLYLDSGTLTPLLKKLEKNGYVNRNRDPKDERNVIISLTKKGKDLKNELKDMPFKVGKGVSLTLDEVLELRRLLKKYLGE